MFLYLPIKQQLYQEDLGNYTSYGIAAWELPAMQRTPCVFIPDVTQDRKAAEHLSVQCTVGQLDPKQLEDVVEDFLP